MINDIETLRGQLREARLEFEGLRGRVHERDETLARGVLHGGFRRRDSESTV